MLAPWAAQRSRKPLRSRASTERNTPRSRHIANTHLEMGVHSILFRLLLFQLLQLLFHHHFLLFFG